MCTYGKVILSQSGGTTELFPTISQRWTALTYACQKEDIASVQSLIKLGANPNHCTKVCHLTNLILIVLPSHTC